MNSPTRIDPRHYDRDIEAEICAHILARPAALADVLENCTIDDFTSETMGRILEVAELIHEDGFTISPAMVKTRLSGEIIQKIEVETGLGPLDFLDGLAKTATPFTKPAELARLVSDLAMRRRLDAEFEAARERLCAHEQPIMNCIGDVIAATGDAAMRSAKSKGYLSIGDAANAMMRTLEDAANGKHVPAIRTGLHRLDSVTGGFQAGDVVIVAGRPGMGKSLLLSGICRAAALAQNPAILFSLEMSRLQLLQRLATDLDYDRKNPSQRSLAYNRLRAGIVNDDEFTRTAIAAQSIAALPLQIFDTAGMTIHEIAGIAEKQAAASKTIGLIAIDYLQIVRATNRYSGSKVNEIGEISAGAKALAKRTGWVVALGCQLNRAVESRQEKRPTLADLRDSGNIEQDADVVIGLHRPAYYVEAKRPSNGRFDSGWNAWAAEWTGVKNDLEMCVLKNRNGPPSVFNVHIDIAAGAIRNRVADANATTIPDDYYPEGYGG